MRLDRLICELNIATRSEAKNLIHKGLISVDGQTVKKPEFKIDELNVVISYKGNDYRYSKFNYFMLNKPAGVVSATIDNIDKTVIDLFHERTNHQYKNDYFPVGRLDKDTVGLLIITNDGELTHRLLSPKYHVNKTYYVKTINKINELDISKIENGIDLGDFITAPAKINLLTSDSCELTLTEGKFHEVKRIFEALNNKVIYLKRISFGEILLDKNLEEGYLRPLTDSEILQLKTN